MTAIYAYANEQFAFVAGDTLRVDRNNMHQTVSKVHHWSDSVLIAQAGEAQFLSDLILKLVRLMGFFPPTYEGFIEAFRQVNSATWCAAEESYEKKGAGPVPEGTLLVAAAANGPTPARIHRVDFQTGTSEISAGPVDADGSNTTLFQADALRHLSSFKAQNENGAVPLDSWAASCVADAVREYRDYIGFPIDVLIARPSAVGDRILVRRRMESELSRPIALFQVP